MQMPGWCTGCSRFRPVTVTSAGLARRVGQAVTGRCDDCEERDRWRGRTVTLRNRSTGETATVRITTASTTSFTGMQADLTVTVVRGSALRTFPRPLWSA